MMDKGAQRSRHSWEEVSEEPKDQSRRESVNGSGL